jgi:long-subunit acyl-CoA synthetase (AMP-forming)
VVANICVYAAEDQDKPIAIIVPVEVAIKKIASENGIQGDSLETLVHNEKLQRLVLQQLQNSGRSGGLKGIEIINGVVLSDEEWTPHNVSVSPPEREIQAMLTLSTGLHDCCSEAAAQEDRQALRGPDQQGLRQEINQFSKSDGRSDI